MDNQEKYQENKMGVMPVNRLLITMSVPIMISMLVQAMYNIVDSMFVARLNENALTAISLVFPIQNLMISVGAGTGVGINALLSRSLGERQFERANKAASHGVLLAVLSSLVFAVFGVFGAGIFMKMQTQDAQIVSYGTSYLQICCIFSIGIFLQITFERLLQSTGKTVYSMITQIAGAVINIVLDPIMIFGLFGFPRMEIAGAAVATVIGQITASIIAVIINHRKNKEIHIRFRGFRWSGAIVRDIYAVGVPSIVMSSIGSVMTFGMNKILIAFSSTATAVFGVYFKLQSFIFMPVFGLNNGMVPIVAFNYGARKRRRITRTIFLSSCYATGIMLLGIAVFQMFPAQLLEIFNASETMKEIGIPALRLISLCFAFAGFNIVCSSVYQAMSHGMLSLWVSLVRQLCVLLPAAYILAKIGGLHAVWWAFPIAEVFSLTMCVIFLRHVYEKEIKPLGESG